MGRKDEIEGNSWRCMVIKYRTEIDMKWKCFCRALMAYIFFVFYMISWDFLGLVCGKTITSER